MGREKNREKKVTELDQISLLINEEKRYWSKYDTALLAENILKHFFHLKKQTNKQQSQGTQMHEQTT